MNKILRADLVKQKQHKQIMFVITTLLLYTVLSIGTRCTMHRHTYTCLTEMMHEQHPKIPRIDRQVSSWKPATYQDGTCSYT
jgi:hypothetical protein